MGWTDERVELLKKLWAEGLSASQIAGRLGGVTRNAVIGKVHRLGLSGRATSSRSSSPRPRRTHVTRQHRASSLMFGTRGNVALKPQFEAEEEPMPAPLPARPASGTACNSHPRSQRRAIHLQRKRLLFKANLLGFLA